MQVTTDAASPGVLMSTDVMVPPYMLPAYIAASRMIPEVGCMPNVSGRSSATPDTGPTPGSAPISVPMMTPATARTTFIGVSATPKPSARFAKRSTQNPRTPTGNGTWSQWMKTSQLAADAATATPIVANHVWPSRKRSTPIRNRKVASVMPNTGSNQTNAVVAAMMTMSRTSGPPRGSHAGPGSDRRVAPTSSKPASTAMARPSQNGRKPEPGPVGVQY